MINLENVSGVCWVLSQLFNASLENLVRVLRFESQGRLNIVSVRFFLSSDSFIFFFFLISFESCFDNRRKELVRHASRENRGVTYKSCADNVRKICTYVTNSCTELSVSYRCTEKEARAKKDVELIHRTFREERINLVTVE